MSDSLSLVFFHALSANLKIGDLPHPIGARNLGLYPAWRQWAAGRGGSIAQIAELLPSPRARYEQCVDLIDAAIKSDPGWESIRRNTPKLDQTPSPLSALGTAPLLFWSAAHVLIEPTIGLQQLLAHSDLGDDIPINFLRPPASACYIHFGAAMRQAILPLPPDADLGPIEGVYVFESVREAKRALALVPIYGHVGHAITGMHAIDLVAMDEDTPLLSAIQHACAPNPALAAHFQSLAQMCTKVFLYFNLAQVQRAEENTYTEKLMQLNRAGPKKAAKLQRQVSRLYDRIILGPQALADNLQGELSPHWRRGHFRMQPHGPQNSLRKVMFIAPTIVRADRLQVPA